MKTDFRIGIVGAGFAGLVAALRLKKHGEHSFVIFERASDIGGTWRDNVYPGCACDVASPLYSFADEPNPNWNRQYASQPEILAYMKEVVANNSLHEHIRLNADVVEARFLEKEGCWQVTDRQGRTCTVKVLLLGMGPLNRPHMPQYPGLETYRGRYFHSAEWDSQYDFQGKRIAVIGTGASAIQIVPSLAPEVAQLTVLQRTPAWVYHRFEKKVSPIGKWLYRRFPLLLKLKREAIYWLNELTGLGLIGYTRINKLMRWAALRKLRSEVTDPAIRKKLTPNYTLGCKRILLSNSYYPAFNRPNVQLVTEPIERFTVQGIQTADGQEHRLDAVIFATGFVAADIELYTRILGLGGRNLVEEWRKKGAEAYLGTTVAGFPNLAFLLGPNTGLGHNSVIHMMESQMHYLMQYLEYLGSFGNGSYLDVDEGVQQAYNITLQEQLKGTVWASGCKSWYMDKRGKNTTLYPGLTRTFRKETRQFNPHSYKLHQQAVGSGDVSVSV